MNTKQKWKKHKSRNRGAVSSVFFFIRFERASLCSCIWWVCFCCRISVGIGVLVQRARIECISIYSGSCCFSSKPLLSVCGAALRFFFHSLSPSSWESDLLDQRNRFSYLILCIIYSCFAQCPPSRSHSLNRCSVHVCIYSSSTANTREFSCVIMCHVCF